MPRLQFTMLSLLVAFAVFAAGLTVFIEVVRQVRRRAAAQKT